MLEDLPLAYNTPEIRIDTTEEKKLLIVKKMIEAFPSGTSENYKINLTDGIRLSFPDGWALCRSSNTQPVLVLRFEASSKQALHRIQFQVEGIVKKYL